MSIGRIASSVAVAPRAITFVSDIVTELDAAREAGEIDPEAAAEAAGERLKAVRDIESSVGGLLEVAGKVGANTANIPQLEATAPVLGMIVDEAIVQDGYMNALTDGYGAVA